MTLTRNATAFIAFMALAAAAALALAVTHGQTWHPVTALTLLAVATATSRMKVKLPGIDGNMSVNLPFLLLSVVALSATEAMLIACASTIVQTLPKRGAKLNPVHLLFNVSMIAVATGAAASVLHASALTHIKWFSLELLVAAATATFFVAQTVPVAIIVSLTDGGTLRRLWLSLAQLTFPYYVVSAGVTSMVSSGGHTIGWLAAASLFPVMFGIYRSYNLYFTRMSASVPRPQTMAAAVARS